MGFLPGGLGFQPEWRAVGVDRYGLELPGSSTVHFRQSLEIFILLYACLCWFYTLSQVRINSKGRKRGFSSGFQYLLFLSGLPS